MSQGRVLLLEDDQAFNNLLVELLEDENLTPLRCASYAALVEQAEQDKGAVAIVDFWGESHATLTDKERQQILHLGGLLPTLLVTGRTWARQVNADDFPNIKVLLKPVDLDELLVQLRTLLGSD